MVRIMHRGSAASPSLEPAGRRSRWGVPPWQIDFHPTPRPIPEQVDVAIVGAGFTGLAAAAWLRHISPQTSVAVFESDSIGAGSSGRTGGMTLAESAAGDLPGLGDVLENFSRILRELKIDCDLHLPGAWEIGRKDHMPNSPIACQDSGDLRVTGEFPGGHCDPGKLVSGLARAADHDGAAIIENSCVDEIHSNDGGLRLRVGKREVRARHAILATNAFSLEMSGLAHQSEPKLTLVVATKPLQPADLEVLGLTSRRPFYTSDLPYLWGRVMPNNGVMFGGGLVDANNWRELESLDIAAGKPAELIANIERRVRGLHPTLRAIEFSHWWAGPVLLDRKSTRL